MVSPPRSIHTSHDWVRTLRRSIIDGERAPIIRGVVCVCVCVCVYVCVCVCVCVGVLERRGSLVIKINNPRGGGRRAIDRGIEREGGSPHHQHRKVPKYGGTHQGSPCVCRYSFCVYVDATFCVSTYLEYQVACQPRRTLLRILIRHPGTSTSPTGQQGRLCEPRS